MIIDTHAHLYFPELKENIEVILENAEKAGVDRIIVPAVDIRTSETALNLSSKYSGIYAAVGFHPCDLAGVEESALYEIEEMCANQKVVGIGETGLDYYWDKSNIDRQKIFFRSHLELAVKHNLPVIIHTRDSIQDAIEIVLEYSGKLTGQFHCFSGDENDLAKILLNTNLFVSFCGNITYKNNSSAGLLDKVPADRLLAETDSPFLPPVPYRGKKNQPAYVADTLKFVSGKKDMDYEKLLEIIYDNTLRLFRGISL